LSRAAISAGVYFGDGDAALLLCESCILILALPGVACQRAGFFAGCRVGVLITGKRDRHADA
jgi:hypothetical protein